MNEIIKKNGINYGIILGVSLVLFTAALYAIDITLFGSFWLGLIKILFFIIISVLVIMQTKKQLRQITFKEAFTSYFISAVIGITISTIFTIILFNFIDTDAKETVNKIAIEKTVEIMKNMGAKTSDIKKAIEKAGDTDNLSTFNQIMGMMVNFIIAAIFGFLLALIFRNKTSNLE